MGPLKRFYLAIAAFVLLTPVALFAQTAGAEIVESIWQVFLATGAIGFVTNLIHQGIKALAAAKGGLSEGIQRVLNLAIAEVLAVIHNLTGWLLPDSLEGFDGAAIEGLLASGLSALIYFLMKALGWQKGTDEIALAAKR